MSIVNRAVDKVYVINMDTNSERMKKCHDQLLANSIAYTRLSAVVGSKVENSKYLTNECNRFCTDGIKGCALSHRAIWEDMILNSYESVLVLEDDFQIAADFNEKFKAAWDAVPKDFDILFVGCKFICHESGVGTLLNSVGLAEAYTALNSEINTTTGAIGAHAYIIRRKCAEKFLGKPIKWHIDFEMQRWVKEEGLKSYSMVSLPIGTHEDSGKTSALAEQYPKLLNSALDAIPISETDTLSWMLGENQFKLAGMNWNVLILLLFAAMLVTPFKFQWIWLVWILAEFVASADGKNTARMGALLGIAALIRGFLIKRRRSSR